MLIEKTSTCKLIGPRGRQLSSNCQIMTPSGRSGCAYNQVRSLLWDSAYKTQRLTVRVLLSARGRRVAYNSGS